MENNRFQSSMKNLASGFLSRFMIIILGMVVRTVFIYTLGNNYLSVNGLYTNILGMLSLAELGFGTAMVYSMYRPLGEHDDMKLASLITLYKKVYQVIGFVVLGLGLCVIPFMDYIIKDPPNIKHLTLYYLMFLGNTVLSYWFFSYKRSILIADQREYVCTNYTNIFTIIKTVIQIIVLAALKNFTVYLVIQLLSTIGENIVISKIADKMYPSLTIKNPKKLSSIELKKIKNDVKGLMLSKIGHILLNSTDNIIISAFIGIYWVGLLSNFTLIIDAVTGVLCQMTSSLSASIGNYFVENKKEDGYILFNRIIFMNSWLYGIGSICLVILLNPFVTLWIGKGYTMSFPIVLVLSLNFFIQGYMNTLWTFRSTLGLFTQGLFRPLIVAGINIVLSIILGINLGVFGVLIATSISRFVVNIWYDPLIIHKYGFEKPVGSFYKMYIIRVLQIISIGSLSGIIKVCLLRDNVTISRFTALAIITCFISVFMFWGYSRNRSEYKYFKMIFNQRLLEPISCKIKR